ncbi:MAG: hypothetical protein ACK58L_14575 [Planctomycetota bacterium]
MKSRMVSVLDEALQPTDTRKALVLAVIATLISLSVLTWNCHRRHLLSAPPVNGGDEDSYERLGYNLAAGSGYGYCPRDLPILEGQGDPQPVDECVAGCSPGDFRLTAYRPPAFPWLIAAVYRLSPLNYAAVRSINCVFSAGAIGIVSFCFARHFSIAAALLLTALCTADSRYREFAGTFLTENMATLAFCLFCLSLDAFLRRPAYVSAALCGVTLSGLVVIRSFYVAWYPFLWIFVAWSLYRTRCCSGRSTSVYRQAAILIAFAVSSISLTAPWWIRNCIVLNAVMPTGTQGGIGLADGFSESAWRNHGSWTAETANEIRDQMMRDSDVANLPGIEFEKEHSRRCGEAARRWIRNNKDRLLQLSWWKLSRLWECGSLLHTILFAVMFVGLFISRQTVISQIMLLLLTLNSLTVMATYHTYERFFTPFRPLLHGFVAAAVVACIRTAMNTCLEPSARHRQE